MNRPIAEIQTDLKAAKRRLKSHRASVGDDMGCDGSGQMDQTYAYDVGYYESELAEARAARQKKS